MFVKLREATVFIAGLGLMGGSLGLVTRGCAAEVIGMDPDSDARAEAELRGAVGEAVGPEEAIEAASSCDLMVLATPLGRMGEVLRLAGPGLRPGTVLTDLGSVKGPLVDELDPLVPPGVLYIPGHPMAGSEEQGMGGAREDLYRGAVWMLASEPPGLLCELIAESGAEIRLMSPAEHDRIVAHTSHLPYLMAAATAAAACEGARDDLEGFRALTAGGFGDTTRVAAGSVHMGADMCLYNAEELLPVLERATGALSDLVAALRCGDRTGLGDHLYSTQQQLLKVRGESA